METTLVALIFAFCTNAFDAQGKERTIACIDDYTNCMVLMGGKIDLKNQKACEKEALNGRKYEDAE